MITVILPIEKKNNINFLSTSLASFSSRNPIPVSPTTLIPPSTRASPHSITKKTTRAEAKTSRLHGKRNYVTANCKLAKELEVSNASAHGKESFSKLCYKCNASYTSSHNKVCPKRKSAFQRKKHLIHLLRLQLEPSDS
jgi:hypothetical protein